MYIYIYVYILKYLTCLQISQNGYLEGFCLTTTSDRLDTKKLSGSFFTPPTLM